MSALAAIFLENAMIFGTDTIASEHGKAFYKDGRRLRETIVALQSKTMYYPHVQTSVTSFGTILLGNEYHRFINNHSENVHINSFDQLLSNTEKHFNQYLDTPEVRNFQKDDELKGSDFLGAIILAGMSETDENGKLRIKPALQMYQLMVYKSKIIKKLLNTRVSDEQGIAYAIHPHLSIEEANKVLETTNNPNSENLIIGLIAAKKALYDKSDRKETMAGGEINMTIMSIEGNRLSVSQYKAHTFDDFEEIIEEIKKNTTARKQKEFDNEISMLLSIGDAAANRVLETMSRTKQQKEITADLEAKNSELLQINKDLLKLGKQMNERISELNGSHEI